MKIEDVARITYEALLAVRRLQGKNDREHWDSATEFHKNVHIDGVRLVLEHSITDPVEAHNKWMEMMVKSGKQGDGDVKHLMVPSDQIDKYEHIKDVLFLQIVNGLKDYIDEP